jgi:hypothetical protein
MTITPSARWSGQVSFGRLNNREVLHPVRDSLRTSASLMYVRPITGGRWAISAIWGCNDDLAYTQPPTEPVAFAAAKSLSRLNVPVWPKHFVSVPTRVPRQIYNSYLLESTLLFRNSNWIWGRVENADKDTLLLFGEEPFALRVEERRLRESRPTRPAMSASCRLAPWLSHGLGGQVTSMAYRTPSRPFTRSTPSECNSF